MLHYNRSRSIDLLKMKIRKKIKKIFFICSCVCLGVIVLFSGFLLYVYFNKNIVKNYAQEWISRRVDASIDIGSLDYTLFPLRIRAKDLKFNMDDASGRIKLSIDEVEGKSDLISFLRKGGQILDSVEIHGIELDAQIKEKKDKKTGDFSFDDLSQQLSPLIKGVSRLSLKKISISLTTYRGQKLNLRNADLVVLTNPGIDGIDFSFSSGEYSTKNYSPEFEAAGNMKLTGHLNLRQIPRLEVEVYVENKTFSSPQADPFFFPGGFVFSAVCETDLENQLDLYDLSLNIPRICELRGEINMDLSDIPSLTFHPSIRVPELKNVLAEMRPYLPGSLSSLDISGSAELEFKGQLQRRDKKFEYSLNGNLILPSSYFSFNHEGIYSSALLSANLSVNVSHNHQKFKGRLNISRGLMKGDNWECKGLSLRLPLSGSPEGFQISGFSGNVDDFFYSENSRILKQNQIRLQGAAAVDLKNRSFEAESLRMTLPPLGDFDLKAKYSPDTSKESFISLISPVLKISDVINSFKMFIPDGLLIWEPEGKLKFEINAADSESDEIRIHTKINLEELSFHDPAFSIAGESISLSFALKNGWVPGDTQIPFSLELSLPKGETLLKNFYVKWADYAPWARIQGSMDALKKSINIDTFDLKADLLGEIQGKGRIMPRDSFDADLSMAVTRIDPVRILGLLGQEINEDPLKMQIKGEGQLNLELRKRGEYFFLKGKAGFFDGFYSDPSKNIKISGVEIDFPFSFDMGFPRVPGWIDFWFERGQLKFEQIQVNEIKLESIRMEMLAARNLFILKPVQTEIFGGTARIYETVGRFEPSQRSFSGSLAFSLGNGRIESLISGQQNLPLTGNFRIDMPSIRINKQKISTEGQIRVDIFQGTATINDIKIDRPFSKNRTFLCDIEFKNFNLKKVTDSLPFGQVTGFVEGKVKDLAVSYGQPEQFSLWIDSVKKKGFSQRFSMKAVDDISILSSGEKSSMGSAKLLSSFVSSFRYKKIGIFCSLQNDVFTLRGTIREKGKELLVKKDWIFGISVVNAKPENHISFKDMLNRLNRIGKSS